MEPPQYTGGLSGLQKREYLAKTCFGQKSWEKADMIFKQKLFESR